MFTSTISETARANRALCFSNVVSSCNIRRSSTRGTQSIASQETKNKMGRKLLTEKHAPKKYAPTLFRRDVYKLIQVLLTN